ncbi:TRAP transporter small permease [Acuticoccus kandeliae]|uniref:TRAP transporter small permease n=1 Tax=Acuticoccus kandeliae TaxID=2073160 RepID=UPI000D3E6BC8|nr:TRAP transporter small permease [Acuticoccus kandeliae]
MDAPAISDTIDPAALPPWLRGLRRALDIVAHLLVGLAMIVLALVFGLMNVEIVSRYLFGVSTLIADEYGGYGFAFVILAGLIYAHRAGALLRVEFGLGLMGRRGRPVALAVASLASLVLCAFSAYAGYKTWALSWLFNSGSAFASTTPLWIPQAVLPVGFALLALSFAEELLSRIFGAGR